MGLKRCGSCARHAVPNCFIALAIANAVSQLSRSGQHRMCTGSNAAAVCLRLRVRQFRHGIGHPLLQPCEGPAYSLLSDSIFLSNIGLPKIFSPTGRQASHFKEDPADRSGKRKDPRMRQRSWPYSDLNYHVVNKRNVSTAPRTPIFSSLSTFRRMFLPKIYVHRIFSSE